MLSEKEKEAIEILKSCGWQVVNGPHLEDWDDGQVVKTRYGDEDIEARVDIAIIKVDV